MIKLFLSMLLGLAAFGSHAAATSLDALTNGLVAYFPLNGNANDDTGTGLTGSLQNVQGTTDRFGRVDHAFQFNGNDSLIDFDKVPTTATEELSILCWLRPDQLPQFGLAVCLGYNDGNLPCDGFSLGIGDALSNGPDGRYPGNKILGLNACVAWIDGKAVFEETNRWYAVAMVRSSGTNYFYLNGQYTTKKTILSPSSPTHFRLGSQVPSNLAVPGYSVFSGAIDDVRIYNRALSGSEIEELYSIENTTIPRAAQAVLQIVNGFIVGVNLIDGGAGYTNAPDVLIISDQGSGASVSARVENGSVVSFTINNPGKGYPSETSVIIASPPFLPQLSIRVSKMMLDIKVVAGKRYQIESSTNFVDWTAVGLPFFAQTESLNQEVPVENNPVYFRIQQIP